MAFLTERELVVRYKGGCSKRKAMPGGGPQGTRLGLFIFLILINAAGWEILNMNIGKHITTKLSKRTPLPNIHMKYVDDLSMAQAIEMKECLVPNPNPTHPLTYHDRTGHILPSAAYTLQDDLNNLAKYTQNHDMVIMCKGRAIAV